MFPRFLIAAIIAAVLFSHSDGFSQGTQDEKKISVSLRMIGHQLLLKSGDSSSLVLPVEKNRNQYRVRFESPFEFNPDELVNTANTVLKEAHIAAGYFMEVERCGTGEIVYSYRVGDVEQVDIIPCESRPYPESCYSLLFTLSRDVAAATDGSSVNEAADSGNDHAITIGIILVVLVTVVMFFVARYRRTLSAGDAGRIRMGKYLFDRRNAVLILKEQRTELSGKEADLLLLLHKSVNDTVKREVILSRVWGDEGDYIGRTLDVFISKLRKKLEADPRVRIVNVRGVGYKLVIE